MTWQPTSDQVGAALRHAAAKQPLEACGVIAANQFIPITNRATEWDAFVMDTDEYLGIAKKFRIEAIVHSHVYAPPIPSDGDKASCEATALPWLIVSWPTGAWQVIEPSGWQAPLVGRKWAWGTHDCFGLIKDGFKIYADRDLPEFDRKWMWWEKGADIIGDQFAEAGFVVVDGPWRHCDVIGMQVPPSPVVNHLGLFLYPDMILHQLLGRYSVREVYGGLWAHMTRLHLRHKDYLDAPPQPPANPYDWGVVQ